MIQGGPYPNQTAPEALTATGPFSAAIGNLLSHTVYYFRSKAEANGVTVHGAETSFTTLKTPLVATTNDATDIATSSVTLNGNLDSLGDYGSADVSFEWGMAQGGPYPNETGQETLTTAGPFSAMIGSLLSNTVYYFRAKAEANSVTVHGVESSFTTTEEAAVPVEVSLVDGWNIIALAAQPDPGYTASTLAADVNDHGGHVTQVFRWNANAATWDFYLVELQYGNDFPIQISYGYLLNNTAACTWVYEGAPLTADYTATVEPRLTNVTEKSFTVSWITQDPEEGHVNYGASASTLDQTAYDDRRYSAEGELLEDLVVDDTHHVTISGLQADTAYYFEVVSGGTTFTDDGAPWQVTTGATLQPNMPEMISGGVFLADGTTTAEGAIVYVQIGTSSSQTMSALVGDTGVWGVNIALIRTDDFQDYYDYGDTEPVVVDAQGAADGTDSQAIDVTTAKGGAPAMSVSLTAEVELVMSWNLIALPIQSATSFTASTMAADMNDQGGAITQVFWWNALAGTWDFYLVDSQYGTDFTIELGQGYLLNSTAGSTWTIQGD